MSNLLCNLRYQFLFATLAAGCNAGNAGDSTADGQTITDPGVETGDSTAYDQTVTDPGAETVADTSTSADDAEDIPADDVNAFIRGLGHLSIADQQPPIPIECEGDDCQLDGPQGEYMCTYTYYSLTEHFDEFVAFEPNSATLWPGSIVEGRDASAGLLTSITMPRAPLTYSASLESLVGSPIGQMEKPSLSQFRATMQGILSAGVNGSTPAKVAFELRQVFSDAEVSLALSTAVSWPGGNKVSGMFDFNSKQTKTRILANFTQAYYTVDVDVPATPAGLFSPGVTVEALETFMSPENPPMYVQSITYGRRAVFSIETDRSEKEVRTALEAVVSAFGVNGDLKVATEHQQLFETSTMRVFVLGGDGGSGVEAVLGYQGLISHILAGGNYSAASPGAAIAYKLAYLDNYGTKFAYTTDFAEANCAAKDVKARKIRLFLKDLYFDGNGEGIGKGEVTYRAWANASGSDECVFVEQLVDQKIGDNQSVGINKACDFTVIEEPGAYVSLSFEADEDGKIAKNAYTWAFDAKVGWPAFGDHTVNAENGNLDVDANLSLSFLE